MLRLLVLAPLFAACTDGRVIAPDAGVDAQTEIDAQPDACVAEPTQGCCEHLPDEDAVRECLIGQVGSGACGQAVCVQADCSVVRVNFCAP